MNITNSKMDNLDRKYPEIYLAIDNCFASKRFTEPHEWMSLIKELGLKYIEASADTECDPLYMTPEYMAMWRDEVIMTSSELDISVCNLYSGHGTYATLGLSHTNLKIRDRILNDWLKPMVEMASGLGAGLGFYCHAFPDQVLQDPENYDAYYEDLVARLAELSEFAAESGCPAVGVEQMYSPHQIPWTINGAKNLIKAVPFRLYTRSVPYPVPLPFMPTTVFVLSPSSVIKDKSPSLHLIKGLKLS